ncbi:hypothetical protein [Hafnia alvei]|uniref:Uncharacterized protein n=1 Tax=Hafnia alvei TaxID=569 RepID=A0A1C6Z6I2_HAFAL|nr:hypothetical protein [Hafnia alvei]NLS54158.1 hypothetical protein [Hafnia alvei]SCM54726.1 hypothetical protein BN1044_04236 [Hafnia alvei]
MSNFSIANNLGVDKIRSLAEKPLDELTKIQQSISSSGTPFFIHQGEITHLGLPNKNDCIFLVEMGIFLSIESQTTY